MRTVRRTMGLAGLGLCLSAATPLAAAGSELFPWSPPNGGAAQRAAPPPDMDKIDKLAAQVNALTGEEKTRVRAEIQDNLNKAAQRGDVPQVKYYGALLERTK